MASSELPDDRRSRPAAGTPADGAGSVTGERPQGRVPGTGANGAPFPGPSEYPPSAPQRLGAMGNGRPGPVLNGPHGAALNGGGPARNGRPGPMLDGDRAATHGQGVAGPPQGRPLGPPPGFGPPPVARPVRPPVPDRSGPRRLPPRAPSPDDRPTDVVEPVADARPAGEVDPQLRVDPTATGPDGIPGRHRRRAGASPDANPASSYVPKRAPGTRKPKSGRRRRSTFWKELPILIGVALVLTIVIQAFLAKVYVIPSGSMETTLHGCTGCNNDRVLVDKVTYRFGDPQPGDVVVFRGPDSWVNTEFTVAEPTSTLGEISQQFLSLIGLAPPDEKDFVKRVIAVGGQTVACCDSRNRVLVNDQPLDEPYIYYLPEAGPARQIPFGPITVPQGELWVMGDSRNNSSDSRIDGHGPIPVENVIGKARLKVLPVGRFGFIDDTNPQGAAAALAEGGLPVALGAIGVLPFALIRRRMLEQEEEFLPRPTRRRR
ncbi:signal peptidase I [Pseudonocardia xishanensis]|uniref:Signal peptidase I n=1 Tax=Pseudonocardia xishanensis TaxID=630995 RepID=A0ABP8RY38_9PSEU